MTFGRAVGNVRSVADSGRFGDTALCDFVKVASFMAMRFWEVCNRCVGAADDLRGMLLRVYGTTEIAINGNLCCR